MSDKDRMAHSESESDDMTIDDLLGRKVISRDIVGRVQHVPDAINDRIRLRAWWHQILRDYGQFSCYAIFLVLPSDTEALRYLSEYGKELDLISAEDCLIMVLGKTEFGRFGFEGNIWEAAIEEYFSDGLSIKVGKMFEIDFDEYPCLLIFQDVRSSRHILTTLRGMDAREIVQKLRSAFSIIHKAISIGKDPLNALEKQRNAENLNKMGRNIVSELRSFAGKTFETAMKAWVEVAIK